MKLPRLSKGLSKKKIVVISLATGLVLGVGGIAAAYIGGSGSGTGTGSPALPTGLKVAIHNTHPTQSTDHGTGQHLTFSVANTSASGAKVRVHTPTAKVVKRTTVTYTGDITSHGSGVAGCKVSWFHVKLTRWKYDTAPTATAHSLTPSTLTPTGHPYKVLTYTLTVGEDLHVTVLVTMVTTPSTPQTACVGHTPRVTLTVK